jgi:hypothetical protein
MPLDSQGAFFLGIWVRGEQFTIALIARRAIRFTDAPGASAQQNSKAFRHEIGIPDDDFLA